MSKKRVWILLLVLLPLTIGGIFVGTLANGSRSTQISLLSATSGLDVADENPLPILESAKGAAPVAKSTIPQARVEPSRGQHPAKRIQSDEQSVPEASPAAEQSVEQGDEVATLAQLGEPSQPRRYLPWSAGHLVADGGAAGAASSASGSLSARGASSGTGGLSGTDGSPGTSGSSGTSGSAVAGGAGKNTVQPSLPDNDIETLPSRDEPADESNDGNSGSGPDLDRGPASHNSAAEPENEGAKNGEPSKEDPPQKDVKKEDPKKDNPTKEDPKKEDPQEGEPNYGDPSVLDPLGPGPIYIPSPEAQPPVVSVPEPGTLGLLGLGLLLLGYAVAWRRKPISACGST